MATYGKKNPKFKTDGYEIHHGIRINKTKSTRPYEVVLPKATGQRSPTRRTFHTKEEAKAFAYKSSIEIENKGRSSLTFTDEMRLDAEQALKILKPYKVNLATAATHYAKHNAEINETNLTSALIDRYLEEYEYRHKRNELRDRSLKEVIRYMDSFKKIFGSYNINLITAKDLDSWLDSLNGNANRANTKNYINGFFRYAERVEGLNQNPVTKCRKVKRIKKPTEIYSLKQVEVILECAEESIVPYLSIGLFAGIRPNELMRLTWEDVNLKNKSIRVLNDTSKTGDYRFVTIRENLLYILNSCKCDGKVLKLTENQLPKVRQRLFKTAGIEHIQDGLRHTWGSYHMAKFGEDKTRIQAGHRISSTIWDFYISLKENLEQDAEEFFKIGLPKAQKVIPIKSAIKAS